MSNLVIMPVRGLRRRAVLFQWNSLPFSPYLGFCCLEVHEPTTFLKVEALSWLFNPGGLGEGRKIYKEKAPVGQSGVGLFSWRGWEKGEVRL